MRNETVEGGPLRVRREMVRVLGKWAYKGIVCTKRGFPCKRPNPSETDRWSFFRTCHRSTTPASTWSKSDTSKL